MTRVRVRGLGLGLVSVLVVVAALAASLVTGLVVWTVATDDAPALPGSETSAPALDSDLAPAATAPAVADVDIDPSLSRDEQIAAIRRQLALLGGTPAATPGRAAAAPRRVADGGPGATVARPDTAAGTRGRGGADARAGRGAPRERRGRGGRSGPGARGRGGRVAAIPFAEPDTGLPPAELAVEPAARPAGLADAAPSVAVLPFANLSRNAADDWISTDMTAALRTALEQTEAMGVVALTAADESTALETARGRGARWLVGGGYQRVGDRLRITARVLVVAGGDLIRSVKMDGIVDELDPMITEMVATVRAEVDGGASALRAPAVRDRVRRPDAGAGGLAPSTADVAVPVVADTAPGGTAATTLVVLPFDDLSPSREGVPTVALGAAITDAVAARLAELAEVTVVSSDDGASWIVGGGVQRIGGGARVTAQLVDVESGSVLTAVKVDGTIDALAELQARVASALSESVRDAFSARDIVPRRSR